jgi:hypothetical protein
MIRSALLEKMDITDIALSEGGYNYYGYVSRLDNAWAIMRANTAGTEFRYVVGVREFPTAWAGRAGFTYVRPSDLGNGNRH